MRVGGLEVPDGGGPFSFAIRMMISKMFLEEWSMSQYDTLRQVPIAVARLRCPWEHLLPVSCPACQYAWAYNLFASCRKLFDGIEEMSAEASFMVRCQFLEIYNETIRDLLRPDTSASALQIRERQDGEIYVAGAKEEVRRMKRLPSPC